MKNFFFLITLIFSVTLLNAQVWRDQEGVETLESVRLKFHKYAEEKLSIDKAKRKAEAAENKGKPGKANDQFAENRVKGFKQFKRWEYYWERRIQEDGSFPPADHTYNEFLKLRAENKRSASMSPATWTHLGPATVPTNGGGAGRINCIAFDPVDNNTIWVGTPAGGLWKSTDGGVTWSSNTDLLPNLGVTDIAINTQNPQIMYIATGDGEGSDIPSIGILKSIDGGLTWNTTGLTYTLINGRYIYRILVDPINPDVLIAACSNGIWRSTDAAATWTQRRTGSTKDLKFKPGNSSVVYGVSGAVLTKSTNNGVTWANSNSGLPTTGLSRMTIAVTPADTNYVYALLGKAATGSVDDYEFHSLYKSTDGAATWTMQSNSPNLLGWSVSGSDDGGQSWYDLSVAASGTDPEVVTVGGVNIWKSYDGGVSWDISSHWYGANGKPYVHADCHMLKFAPNSDNLFACVDGGLFRSSNAGNTWSDYSEGLQIMQFYKIGCSATNPDRVIGGSQDNGTNMMLNSSWDRVIGGDGMECLVDHTDDQIMFGELYYGDIQKSIDGGQTFYPVKPSGSNDGDWVTPFAMDPNDNTTMYLGLDEIYKSSDNGDNWSPVTTNLSSGALYKCLTVANSNSLYVYASTGTNVYKSTDGGTTWTTITAGLPLSSLRVTYLDVKPSDANTIYVTLSAYSAAQKVYRSTDGGATWVNFSSTGLPNTPMNCIEVENNSMTGLYVGTDLGVFYRNDTMSTWIPYNTGLPNVIVNELEINYMSAKLRAGTYGRGLWESDLYTYTPTSIASGASDSYIKVYPVPAKDVLSIENLDFSGVLEITGENGQVVYKSDIREGSSKIDVSKLSSGIYFLNITKPGKSFKERIIINK